MSKAKQLEYPEAVREAPELLERGVTKERVQALLHPDRHVNEYGELGYDGAMYSREVLEVLYDSLSGYDDPFNAHREHAGKFVDPQLRRGEQEVPAIAETAVEQLESVLEEVDSKLYEG